ncbi:hypothetical protein AGLY_004563 [Aphis glycines]|uniref:YqaJ viral recombinase domain-containing protein n=1 Tax=Aphis glycines TaxID=307491 RepID=A0A6G0TYU0_APHGL|nr:hypothetical protein AGLY_004563 [Aphis glycines]
MRPTTSCKNIVANKLYSTSSSTNEPIACKYGKDMEPVAQEYFEKKMKTTIQKCGLIIDEDYPFFGASPGPPQPYCTAERVSGFYHYIYKNKIINPPILYGILDGLIGNDSIIEVKCPYSAKDYPTIEEAIKDKKIKFLRLNECGEITLKKDDNYYFQIIGQLRISKRDICHFILYSHN